MTVVGERDDPERGKLRHLCELLARKPLRDPRHEAHRDARLLARPFDERSEDGSVVDGGIRVRHRHYRAVPAGGGSGRARRQGLLVLAAGRAEMDVRIDEGRRDDEPVRRALRRRQRGDHTVLDRDVELRVHPGGRIDDMDASQLERVARVVTTEQH